MVCAQTSSFPNVKVRVVPETNRVVIEGSTTPRTAWSFPDEYAGVLGLGNRISDFQAFDPRGEAVEVRKKAPGQFASAVPASSFKYSVNLSVPMRLSDAALVSWLNVQRGVLMPGDLLPADLVERTNIRIELPPGWNYHASQITFSGNAFPIVDAGRFLFVVGKGLRLSTKNLSGSRLNLISDGDWAFQDSEAVDLSEKF